MDSHLQPLYQKYGVARSPFRSVDRLKLIYSIVKVVVRDPPRHSVVTDPSHSQV
jgi:hypothetical protein